MKRNEETKNIFSKYKKEILMTVILLFIAVISLLIITLTRKPGDVAEIYVSDTKISEYALDKDGVYPILGEKMTLVIEDGKAFIEHSDCPDKVCIKTGKIHLSAERIVCLPNKVTVIIRGEKTGDEPDLVS